MCVAPHAGVVHAGRDFREDEHVLVVFDTNVLHGDVRADRNILRSLLDEALPNGAFEVFLPEIVLLELDRQFAARCKKVVKDINKALADYEKEIRELGLPDPRMSRDDEDIAGYRAALQQRLESAGVTILALPEDLSPTIEWAVNRRKPFKPTAEGLPDAVIWLSVLELADAHPQEEIVLISNNTTDFAESKKSPELAEVLRDDLEARGRPREQVRLSLNVRDFAEEIGERLESANVLAKQLAREHTFDDAIERALMFSRIDAGTLNLGVELDNDPQVSGWDLEDLKVLSTVELPGERLVVRASARVMVQLDVQIFKADYYLAAEHRTVRVSLTNADFNKHYVEAESEADLDIALEITTNADASEVAVEITSVSLSSFELMHRTVHTQEGLEELLETVQPALMGAHVEGFTPRERLESDIETANVSFVYPGGSARLSEVIESDDERHLCQLEVAVDADVEWSVTAPSGYDIEIFAGLALNEESDAPILQGHDTRAPLSADLSAWWDREHGWHDVELASVQLTAAEARRREQRTSAAEERRTGETDPEQE